MLDNNSQKLNTYRQPDKNDDVVFDKHWFSKHQSKLLWLANSWLGKHIFKFEKMGHFLDPKKKIVKITPYSVAQFNRFIGKEAEFTEHFFSRNEYARKLYFYLYPLWITMHIWDWFVADHFQIAPQLSFGFSTLTQYPGSTGTSNPVDGGVGGWDSHGDGTGDDWSTIHNLGTGNVVEYNTQQVLMTIRAGFTTNKWRNLYRSIFCFDTSALTSGATISDVVLSLCGANLGKTNQGSWAATYNIYTATPAGTTSLTGTDYQQIGTTAQATAISYASINDNAYNAFAFNSTGRGNVSKTSISKFGLREASFDVANSPPTWAGGAVNLQIYFLTSVSASNKPKIVVTYTTAVAPTVTTQAVSSIAQTTATGNGNVTADGGATVTERGVCWSTSSGSETAGGSHATSGGTTGAFTASITGLTANTTYYVKAYAINSVGTSYGSEVSFTTPNLFTLDCLPASFTYTPQAQGENMIRKMACLPASFIFTAQAIGISLAKIYTMVCLPATYVYTGMSIGIKNVWKMACTPATYIFTGIGAGINKAVVMICTPAQYVFTGMSAGIHKVIVMICTPASYVFIGLATGIHRGFVMICSPATYIMTGQVMTSFIKRVYVLTCQPAIYLFKGMSIKIQSTLHTIWKKSTQGSSPTSWKKTFSGN